MWYPAPISPQDHARDIGATTSPGHLWVSAGLIRGNTHDTQIHGSGSPVSHGSSRLRVQAFEFTGTHGFLKF